MVICKDLHDKHHDVEKSERTGQFVYKLIKLLYGLKNAPQIWNETISKVFTLDFKQCVNEPCLFYKNTSQGLILLGMYVDDFVVCRNKQATADTNKALGEAFKMKDLGPGKKFLGFGEGSRGHTKIHHGDYIKSILKTVVCLG